MGVVLFFVVPLLLLLLLITAIASFQVGRAKKQPI